MSHRFFCFGFRRKPARRGLIPVARSPVVWTCVGLLLGSFLAALGGEVPATGAFDAANKLYAEAKYPQAAAGYEKLLQTGRESEAVYFNLGNAWFKAGKIGRAISAYREAERLAPRDPDVRANLQFARNQVQGPTLVPDRLERWLGKLSLNEWTGLAAFSVWGWFLLLTLMQWRPALKPLLKGYAVWLGGLMAVLCLCLAADLYVVRFTSRAIVIAEDAVARQAPIQESQSAFTLHDGAELQILDQKDQWLQVKADARRIGWVPRDAVAVGYNAVTSAK